jgi:hypothetical protein
MAGMAILTLSQQPEGKRSENAELFNLGADGFNTDLLD